ncbi:MAG: hypothetical protein Q9160_007205 [Pyrenula sp. 1 TL-2023]
MSFGYSVSDIITLGTLAWKTYKSCKEAPSSFAGITQETLSLHAVLREMEEALGECKLEQTQMARLRVICDGCNSVLEDLNELVRKYESLGTQSQRTWDRMNNAHDLQYRIKHLLTCLIYRNTQVVVEQKLRKLLVEFQTGKRENSAFSRETIDSISDDRRRDWREIRKALEEIEVSIEAFNANEAFIIKFFRIAIASGHFGHSDGVSEAFSAMFEPDLAGTEPPDRALRSLNHPSREVDNQQCPTGVIDKTPDKVSSPLRRNRFRQLLSTRTRGQQKSRTDVLSDGVVVTKGFEVSTAPA